MDLPNADVKKLIEADGKVYIKEQETHAQQVWSYKAMEALLDTRDLEAEAEARR